MCKLTVLVLLAELLYVSSSDRVRWVTTTGTDVDDCGATASTACASLPYASTALGATGGTVMLARGAYSINQTIHLHKSPVLIVAKEGAVVSCRDEYGMFTGFMAKAPEFASGTSVGCAYPTLAGSAEHSGGRGCLV